eukprot:TRINITY_DN57587_c0_g1_i1.p1 TRINITY_DN57587_c0_g1~~TRINITY_DN57587_c0_g1_i1.p1  ORF type:complete len:455 (-),score=63.01 TRINITY_DN57587_c0_g1_i1:118-1428(-)
MPLKYQLPVSAHELQKLADDIKHPMTPQQVHDIINNVKKYTAVQCKKQQFRLVRVYQQGSRVKHTDTVDSDVDIVVLFSGKQLDTVVLTNVLKMVARQCGGTGIWHNANCVGCHIDGHAVELVPTQEGQDTTKGPAQANAFLNLPGGLRQCCVLLRTTRLIKHFCKHNKIRHLKSCCLEMLVRCALNDNLNDETLPLKQAVTTVLDFLSQLAPGDQVIFKDDNSQEFHRDCGGVLKVTLPVTGQDVAEKVTARDLKRLNKTAREQLALFGISADNPEAAFQNIPDEVSFEATPRLGFKTMANAGLTPFSGGGLYGNGLGPMAPTGTTGSDYSSDTTSTLSALDSAAEEIQGLTFEEINDGQGLAILEEKLCALHNETGISMNKLKKVIKEFGYALGDCKRYGPQLRQVLRKNKHLIIPKDEAKAYDHVRRCLVQLS